MLCRSHAAQAGQQTGPRGVAAEVDISYVQISPGRSVPINFLQENSAPRTAKEGSGEYTEQECQILTARLF